MCRKFLVFLCFSWFYLSLIGQERLIVSGFVYDFDSREVLAGATVIDSLSGRGTTTNVYGFYSLILDKAEPTIVLKTSYVGYQSYVAELTSISAVRHDIYLKRGIELSEIVFTASDIESITSTTEIGTTHIPMADIKILPNLFGEVDIIKAFQMTPGVQSGGEGKSELFVRGGSPDQNLILLDDVPLYYVAHFGGFLSTFNSDAISDVKLIKGGFPARYGGRLSSVLDVRMKDGNMSKFHGQGSLGLLSSRLMLEGPLKKESSSYMVSARGSLLPIHRLLFQNLLSYNFFDINAKMNFLLTENDRLYISFYSGDDFVVTHRKGTANKGNSLYRSATSWGNIATSLRYNRVLSTRAFGNIILAYSRYRYINSIENSSEFDIEKPFRVESSLYTGVADLLLKADFSYNALTSYQILFGASTTYHSVRPKDEKFYILYNEAEEKRNYNSLSHSLESGIYMENEIKIGRVGLNAGLRGVNFLFDDKSFTYLEPRINFNIPIVDDFSVKGAYSITNQFMHLLTFSGAGMPADYWMPSTDNVRPSRASQYNIGFAKSFDNSGFLLTLEGYMKKLDGIIAFQPGATLVGNLSSWENVIEQDGKGVNYGVEFFLQKAHGRSTGWIGFALSRANRQFDNLNGGKEFPFRYDRLIDINFVWNFKLIDRIYFSTTWAYGSGYPITLASEKYYLEGDFEGYPQEVLFFNQINSFRMRSYHRLDFSLNYSWKTSWGESTWTFSIFNVYNRRNPYFYFYDRDAYLAQFQSKPPLKLKQMSLFPFFPSVGYNFKF